MPVCTGGQCVTDLVGPRTRPAMLDWMAGTVMSEFFCGFGRPGFPMALWTRGGMNVRLHIPLQH